MEPGARLGDRGLTFKDHFSAGAGAYARHRPVYPPELAEVLAAHAPSRVLALDVGTGSGQLAVLLADCFERVVATDASAAQIAHATAHPRVEYRVAPAEASGLPDASVDLVVAAQAAHWFDLDAFYAEARRIAKPRALLALVSYAVTRIAPEIDAVVDHFHDVTLEGHWPPERIHVVSGYARLPFPFEEVTLPAVAMHARWDLAALLGYLRTWSGLVALAKTGAEGAARIAGFEAELTARWGDAATVRDVRWPLAVRATRL